MFLPGESQGGRAWWAAVYGVAQSRTRLKWLSSSSKVYLLYYNHHHKLTVGYFISPVTNSGLSQLSLFCSPWQLFAPSPSLQTSLCWTGLSVGYPYVPSVSGFFRFAQCLSALPRCSTCLYFIFYGQIIVHRMGVYPAFCPFIC